MGVKLADIVTKKPLSFDDLTGKKIALDFSNSAYQFLSSIRQPDGTHLMDNQGRITSHLVGIWSRFTNLMQRDIKLAIVLDGQPPDLKLTEATSRHERKKEAEEKYQQAREEENTEKMALYAKQFTRLTKEMTGEAAKLLTAMGLPVIQAPEEADAQMAYMNKQGDVWASGSSDYDCLLHGAPCLLTNLTLSQKKRTFSGAVIKIHPYLIELEEVLNATKITQEQLIYLAIIVGTDYNEGVHGYGPKKALKAVQTHEDPEELFSALDADFDWREVYNTFTKMKVQKKYVLVWTEPDAEKIRELLVEEHNFSEERVNATLEKLQKGRAVNQKGLHEWFK